MNRITFPLEQRASGPQVADLQDALRACLERDVIRIEGAASLRRLLAALQKEREQQLYGEATARLVSLFQKARGLETSGQVDRATAEALNAVLEEWGLLERPAPAGGGVVSGQVRREDGLPLPGARVHAWHDAEVGPVRLGEDITDAEGRYTIRYEGLPGVERIDLRVSVFDGEGRLLRSSDVVRGARPLEQIDMTVALAARPDRRRIEGRIVLENGLSAEGLKLRLYRRDFGGKATLLAEAVTAAGGRYILSYDWEGRPASLEVRVVKESGEEVALSSPLTDLGAGPVVVLNLVAPADLRPLEAEYRRLVADLLPHVGEMAALASAREDDERQDLTVLNRATGWDARLLALAAIAERLSADPDIGLPAEGLYGLLRAGLPSGKLLLAQVGADTVERALKAARQAGIIDLDDQAIASFKERFATFAGRARLALPAPGSLSTYEELLEASGLDESSRTRFAAVFLEHRGTAAELWEKARQAGLDDAQVRRLQLQGRLAYLVGNSAPLVARLLDRVETASDLVERDFYEPETWKAELRALAGDDEELSRLIPSIYQGESAQERLEAYAQDMARKVRLSYPTQVVARTLERDDADAFRLGEARAATAALLKKAAALGFRLGQTPPARFLMEHPEALEETGPQAGMATEHLKTLHRVYQVTPSDEAMPVLLEMGLTSAHDITALTEEQFAARYVAKYESKHGRRPPGGEARLVYRKAQQVSVVVDRLLAEARGMGTVQGMPVVSSPATSTERMALVGQLVRHLPTLETLLGSQDFCECEHCHSVLSPAAYLVDLLQFLDPEEPVWNNFLEQWEQTHGGERYTDRYQKPYDALVRERRPDIPHIPLTCENTHTALPYIDLVNEILEYYVAKGKLDSGAAGDTGATASEDLLAEPQSTAREDQVALQAYDALYSARYPLALPFDLWLETVRQFCDFFEAPFWRLLETFRPTQDLFASGAAYGHEAVFRERLGLSPAEHAVFTDPAALATWQGLYGCASDDPDATLVTDAETGESVDLSSAKVLARRLAVSYRELVELVKTGFVNPRLAELGLLDKLGASIADARSYLDHRGLLEREPSSLTEEEQRQRLEAEAFRQRLERLGQEFSMAFAHLEAQVEALPFDDVLVLSGPEGECDFEHTALRYASGRPAEPIALLRLNLFVRLWRRLGWSIEETDRALQVFVPSEAPFEPEHLNERPLRTALVYLAHLKALEEALGLGADGRLKLLTLWSELPTTGERPLYAQLFLVPGVLKSDPVFDSPLGRYLEYFDAAEGRYRPFRWDASQPESPQTGNVSLKAHMVALQGALGLTADDVQRILADAGLSLESAALTLSNVSLLYRYALLARALELSVRELIALRQLSGLEPFKPLEAGTLTTLGDDHPFTQTLRFVETVEQVRASGFNVEDLEYLLRHRFDPTGRYRPARAATLLFLKGLAATIRAIRAEHAVPSDPGALSEEALQQKLGLLLPSEVARRFLAMLNGTVEFTATVEAPPANRLEPSLFVGEPSLLRLAYDETLERQSLTFRGVLLEEQKGELLGRFAPSLSTDQQAVLRGLLDDVQAQARSFFEAHLERSASADAPTTGFLEAADYELLFAPLPEGLNEAQRQERLAQRRARLARALFPVLQQRLAQQAIVRALVDQTGGEAALVEALLTDSRLVTDPASPGGDEPLLAAFEGLAGGGVTARFFSAADATGSPLATLALADADTGLGDASGTPLRPLGANSVLMEGYLEVPVPGAYRFYVVLERQNAEAELRFEHVAGPLLSGTASADGQEFSQHLELAAGVPYRFTLEARNLQDGEARLLVRGEGLARGGLARLVLYPGASMERAERACLLLRKALQLVEALGLGLGELRYLLTHRTDFDGLDLSRLPTRPQDDTPAGARALFGQFLRLAAYARLKGEMAGGREELTGIFEASAAGDLESAYSIIARVTRRDAAVVKEVAQHLFAAPAFTDERPLWRLWEALQVVERFGVPVASLTGWTGVVDGTAPAAQRFAIARQARETVRARFDTESWRRVAQPIFDRLRRQRRDALVAYTMRKLGFQRQEQLYEYFLIDPGMEPVVRTSRIRLAIASVQLFVQRCLLNLEPDAPPAAINASRWEWMKRYRVWEANRKVFLFPENWLEPEFRDDKTSLFQELEGALFQGDVSDDLVEDAFLNYLKKLDELARLKIVAMHLEYRTDAEANVLHVFGRTHGQPHKYFYRRFLHQSWTPWEPVTVDVQGDHLAPVVWRDRLYLFWVTFMERAEEDAQPGSRSSGRTLAEVQLSDVMNDIMDRTAHRQLQVQLHWSVYTNGKWSPPESSPLFTVLGDDGNPLQLHRSSFSPSQLFVFVSKEPYEEGEERGVYVHLVSRALSQSFYLAGRNSPPVLLQRGRSRPSAPYPRTSQGATDYLGESELRVTFRQSIVIRDGEEPEEDWDSPSILKLVSEQKGYSLVPCNNEAPFGDAEVASLERPVFFQDHLHTFFIEPDLTEESTETWEGWLTPIAPVPAEMLELQEGMLERVLEPWVPVESPLPMGPDDPVWRLPVDPRSLHRLRTSRDWLVNPSTALEFDGGLVGAGGRIAPGARPGEGIVGRPTTLDGGMGVPPGGATGQPSPLAVRTEGLGGSAGRLTLEGRLHVVGRGGLDAAALERLAMERGPR